MEEGEGSYRGYVIVAVVYLLGLFMGALDSGIITPARTIIQGDLGVDDSLGIWILTIYTLSYASSIPIMGKLADMFGRKYIYLFCVLLFGLGSFASGLSQNVGNFWLLIAARCVQAIGGGGIMPIATAEVGTSFPPQKRGMALGLVGAVYGVASVFGASAGSLILDIVGQHNWQYIFYINVPICVVVAGLGFAKLPNTKAEDVKPIDILGILVLTLMILSLMYFLKIVDFFDFANSISDAGVYPFLLIFVVLIPFFILIERHAKDPVINLSYFTNINIVVTLLCSIISGIILMGVIFLPEFCENALYMASGDGGYFIIILGLFCGIGSPMTGTLIDKFGVKPPLVFGFAAAAAGSAFLAFVACAHPGLPTVVISLALLGLGMGFTMGTPLNYMMLDHTEDSESNSAMAVLSLVRSMGTAVAPAIMVAFIVHAGSGMQDSLTAVMPQQVTVSSLPYAQELDDEMAKMRSDENFKKMLKGIDIPKLADYETIDVDMDSDDGDFDAEISDEILDELQNSDITTVTQACKDMASDIFDQVKPKLVEDATGGLESGLGTMKSKSRKMRKAIAKMDKASKKLSKASSKMSTAAEKMASGVEGIQSGIDKMDGKIKKAEKSVATMDKKLKKMGRSIKKMKAGAKGIKTAMGKMQAQADQMKATMGPAAPPVTALEGQINTLQTKLEKLNTARSALETARSKVSAARNGISKGIAGMRSGRASMVAKKEKLQASRQKLLDNSSKLGENSSKIAKSKKKLSKAHESLARTIAKLQAVDQAIPGLFDEAQVNYLAAIDGKTSEIQQTYQSGLNEGFKGMFIFVGICSLVALLLLGAYKGRQRA